MTGTLSTGAKINIAYAFMLGWPIVLTGIIAITYRRRLRRPFAFICLGYLVCVGIFYLISYTDAFGGWIHIPAVTRTDKLFAVVMNRGFECVAAAIPLSILPLAWLCKTMLSPSQISNPDLRAGR